MRRRGYESRAGNYHPEPWRDVAAAYLVHYGLTLATATGRYRMLHVLSDEWRAAVGREIERLAAHPAGCRPGDPPRA